MKTAFNLLSIALLNFFLVLFISCKKDEDNSINDKPVTKADFVISGISEDETIAIGKPLEIELKLTPDGTALKKVEFYLNTTLIESDTVKPYSIKIETEALEQGIYNFKAIAVINTSESISKQVKFNLKYDFIVTLPKDGFYTGQTDEKLGSLSFSVEGKTIKNLRRKYTNGNYLINELYPSAIAMIPQKEGFKVNTGNYNLTGSYDGKHTIVGNVTIKSITINYRILDIIPPEPKFSIKPQSANFLTTFKFDPDSTIDEKDLKESLKIRWDFEGDSIWDTDWHIIASTDHIYKKSGQFKPILEVIDSDSLISRITKTLDVHRFIKEPVTIPNVTFEEIPGGGFIAIKKTSRDQSLIRYDSEWTVIWETPVPEQGGYYDEPALSKIKLTSDNGFFFVGSYRTRTSGTGSTQSDIFMLKTDQNGIIEWKNIIGTSSVSDEMGEDVIETSSGGYLVIGGRYWKNSLILLKLNSEGTKEIEKRYERANSEGIGFVDIVEIANNEYYIFENVGSSSTGKGILLTRVDTNCEIREEKNLLEGIKANANVIRKSLDDNYIIGGEQYLYNGLIFKMDKSGSILWQTSISGSRIYDFFELPDNGLITLGSKYSTTSTICNIHKLSPLQEVLNKFEYQGISTIRFIKSINENYRIVGDSKIYEVIAF